MPRTFAFILAIIIVSFSAWAREPQHVNRTDVVCDITPGAASSATKSAVHEEAVSTNSDSSSDLELGMAPSAVDLANDLKFLGERQSALADCILSIDVRVPAENSSGACAGELLLNFAMRHDGEPERDIPIGRLVGTSAFFYESGMTIDADGAPNAYHPENTGLDDLANAGAPGRWEGLAKDGDGQPFIQGSNDPFPGYYVSATALADHSKAVNDPARYVDASKIPFIVLPGGMARQIGARPGDFAVVFNERNGKSSFAIYGDVGPADRIGEGSVALAENLGIHSDARNGGAHRGVIYLVFPGSGNGRPRTMDEINGEGQKLLQSWESAHFKNACSDSTRQETSGANHSGN